MNPSPPLDETISAGQTAHIHDHEVIAETLNTIMDAVIVRRTTAQSIANNTATHVSFQAATYQNAGSPLWVIGAPTRLTVVETGEYMFGASVRWAANATGIRKLDLLVSGTYVSGADERVAASGSVNPIITVAGFQYLTAGQYVEARVYQNSGGALDIDDAGFDDQIWGWMKRVG